MPMSADDNRAMLGRWLKTAAVWVVVCAGSVCAALLGVLSVERLRSPVDIQNAYVVLVIAQTFFMIFLWPLFVRAGSWWNTAVQLVALFALAVPLILVTLRTSDVRMGSVLGSQALVLLFGVTAAAAIRMARNPASAGAGLGRPSRTKPTKARISFPAAPAAPSGTRGHVVPSATA